MIEARENIDLVTMKRQGDLESSQRDYETLAAAPAPQTDAPALALPSTDMQAVESALPPDSAPADAAPSSITGSRLCIAGAFVLLLLLFWFVQRRR